MARYVVSYTVCRFVDADNEQDAINKAGEVDKLDAEFWELEGAQLED